MLEKTLYFKNLVSEATYPKLVLLFLIIILFLIVLLASYIIFVFAAVFSQITGRGHNLTGTYASDGGFKNIGLYTFLTLCWIILPIIICAFAELFSLNHSCFQTKLELLHSVCSPRVSQPSPVAPTVLVFLGVLISWFSPLIGLPVVSIGAYAYSFAIPNVVEDNHFNAKNHQSILKFKDCNVEIHTEYKLKKMFSSFEDNYWISEIETNNDVHLHLQFLKCGQQAYFDLTSMSYGHDYVFQTLASFL